MKKVYWIISIVLISLASCKQPATEVPSAPIILKGLLTAGETIDNIYVEQIASSRELESVQNIPLENAEISIFDGDQEIILYADTENPGYYGNPNELVKLNTAYSIKVDANGEVLTASCFVPDTIEVTTLAIPDPAVVGGENTEPILNISWIEQPGYEYLFDLDLVNPEIMDELTFTENLGRFDDFYALPTKETSAVLFDIDFKYSGVHKFTVFTVTPEYSDYIKYDPQSFDRRLFDSPNNVQGGYGVFAGVTSTTFLVNLQEEI